MLFANKKEEIEGAVIVACLARGWRGFTPHTFRNSPNAIVGFSWLADWKGFRAVHLGINVKTGDFERVDRQHIIELVEDAETSVRLDGFDVLRGSVLRKI